ncbi:MAG TPA: arginine deiminase-related protein [Rhizomicrobium sp.]|nr:arginine deiminase-related protein [Rhizomicrobium sp.]
MDQPIFLMTEPDHFGVVYQINPWMRPDSWHADPVAGLSAARAASRALRAALIETGAKVEMIPAAPGLPDLVFPANAAIILDGVVVPARFRHPERQGEEAMFRAAFETLKARGLVTEIVELPPDVIQEGAGDCIWDADRGLFWVGHGQRSSANSVPAIAQAFGKPLVALELASPRFYHLDTCFCPLQGGKLLFYPPAFTPEALAAIHSQVAPKDRIEASDEEAQAFCVNAVNFGRQVVMAKAPQSLRHKLTALGYRLHEVDLAPFILSGGGAYCMTLRLDRRSGSAQLRIRA